MSDYQDLKTDNNDAVNRVEKWLEASDELANRMASRRGGRPFDTNTLLAAAKADLEGRHDFLRSS